MKKFSLIVIIFLFTALAGYLFLDTVNSFNKFSENKEVISNLELQNTQTSKDISALREKINRVDTDKTYINNMITRKFKMLKKDQFIIHE